VLLAGLYVALIAGSTSDVRVFGWVLVVVGVIGVGVGALMRRRGRN
jgi:hypothetical protein